MLAWQAAERMNRTVRLLEFTPNSTTRRDAGEDLSVLCNVSAEQPSTVISSTRTTHDGTSDTPSRRTARRDMHDRPEKPSRTA